jgi:hypothetical protein
LYQASIHSKIADASSVLVVQRRWSSSSRCVVDQKLSVIELSSLLATRPIPPRTPAWRSRCPKTARGVLPAPVRVDDRSGARLAGTRRHLQGVDDELCAQGSAMDQPTICRLSTSSTAQQ